MYLFLPINLFFQRFSEAQFDQKKFALKSREEEQDKNRILCKACQHPITSYNNKIEFHGQHQHLFSNPSGFVFEIGCFSAANGCLNRSPPSFEYTWFEGFAWSFALCSNCYTHLGWFYQSENYSFYGLIINKLDEAV